MSDSSVHGISQARILGWVANSFSRGSFRPKDWTPISYTGKQILYHWATREAQIRADPRLVRAAMKLRLLLLGRKAMTNLDSILKSRDITLPTKVRLVKAMFFPVVMYGCESWTIKKAEHRRTHAFWTVVLEKTLESPLDCKEIQPAHPKGDQFWVLIGRTDVEAETTILWPPDGKSWLIGKDLDAGKD